MHKREQKAREKNSGVAHNLWSLCPAMPEASPDWRWISLPPRLILIFFVLKFTQLIFSEKI